MKAAMKVEALKLVRSPVGVIAAASIVGGVVVLIATMMAAIRSGNLELTAKLGADATFDWSGLVSGAAQITGAGGLIGFGVVLAWLFAREFADGTITGLFGLPVGRGTIAAAKLAIYALWAIGATLLLSAALLVLGLILGFGPPDAAAWAGIGRQSALGFLTAAVALPVAWVATAARSLLAGVSCAIGLVVVAQVGALTGMGGWMPVAAPSLWAISGGTAVSAVQLAAPVVLAGVVGAVTVWSWHRLQLDR
ncbi:ABC transporter permease [Microbacterium pumilum]|uniref:ABC transporter permease n=1 Tax=Microbacterium pumilum TaxID=344165 RepID=A0ABP5DMD8_9MICO